MNKFQNNMLPKAFDQYFKRPSHQHATRYAKKNNFEKTRAVNAKDKSLLKHIGPNKWSLVPHDIKETPLLKTFMNLYRTHLIDT